MERPKSITQLSREQLEDFCLSMLHSNHVTVKRMNVFEEDIDSLFKQIENGKEIFTKDELLEIFKWTIIQKEQEAKKEQEN